MTNEATDRPYCRGANAIFRKLPNNGAECVIDFRDASLLPSVLFHLNGEYHQSQMWIRESLELQRGQLQQFEAKVAELVVKHAETRSELLDVANQLWKLSSATGLVECPDEQAQLNKLSDQLSRLARKLELEQ